MWYSHGRRYVIALIMIAAICLAYCTCICTNTSEISMAAVYQYGFKALWRVSLSLSQRNNTSQYLVFYTLYILQMCTCVRAAQTVADGS